MKRDSMSFKGLGVVFGLALVFALLAPMDADAQRGRGGPRLSAEDSAKALGARLLPGMAQLPPLTPLTSSSLTPVQIFFDRAVWPCMERQSPETRFVSR